MPVGLDGRQVEDLPARVERGDLNPFREDVIQLQQRAPERIYPPFDIGQRCKRQAGPAQDRLPAVVAAAFARTGHHRPVLDRDEPPPLEPVVEHLRDDAVQLPGLRGACRKVLRPRQVQLEERVARRGKRIGVAGKLHDPRVVLDHALGAGTDDRDPRRSGGGG